MSLIDKARRATATIKERAAMRRKLRGPADLRDKPVLVTTYCLRNTKAKTITRLRGSVTVRTQADPMSLMGVTRCFIEHSEPNSGGLTTEVRCGNPNHGVGSAQKDYVDLPGSALVLTREPKYVEFATGKVLRSTDRTRRTLLRRRYQGHALHLGLDLAVEHGKARLEGLLDGIESGGLAPELGLVHFARKRDPLRLELAQHAFSPDGDADGNTCQALPGRFRSAFRRKPRGLQPAARAAPAGFAPDGGGRTLARNDPKR